MRNYEEEFKSGILKSYEKHGRARTVTQGANLAWKVAAPLIESASAISEEEFWGAVTAVRDLDTSIAESGDPQVEAVMVVQAVLKAIGVELIR